jgi:hypothetical protein
MRNTNNPPARAALLPQGGLSQGVWRGTVSVLYFLAVLTYPVIKWIFGLDVFLQFLKMLFTWNEPHVHAGWTFLVHFGLLTAYTCFVTLYRPSWLEDEKK